MSSISTRASRIPSSRRCRKKDDWRDAFPLLNATKDIWRLLGKRCAISVESDQAFHLQADCTWDTEHGLTVRVRDWRIEP
ncbi:DUF6985 domain-containing protein [Methylobacterium iners]|uniref:DUF6985 domain-containing protein n=1 Tax=Methylobacterium iners TaxID=418707 RepID=UPI0035A227D9